MDDAELVLAARDGKRTAFAAIYDRYADRVHDVCFALVRDRARAAELAAEVFAVAGQRLTQLRDPARLRAWLFAIARHQSMLSLHRGGPGLAETPAELAAAGEGAGLVWEASAGLPARERALLDLALRQGLEGQDLADAMGLTLSQSYVLLAEMRGDVERDLGAFLVLRRGQDVPAELAKAGQGWDERFDEGFRKRVARIDHERLRGDEQSASPLAVYAAVPLLGAPEATRTAVLESVELPTASPFGLPAKDTVLPAPAGDQPWLVDGFPPADFTVAEPGERRGVGSWLAVAALLLVLALIGAGLGYLLTKDDGGEVATEAPTTTTRALLPSVPLRTTTSTTLPGAASTTVVATVPGGGTSTSVATTATTSAATTTSSTAAPAGILAGPGSVRFGTTSGAKVTQDVLLRNRGTGSLTFTGSTTLGLSVSPVQGSIPAGGQVVVKATFDPNTVPENDGEKQVGQIRFDGSGGSTIVTASARVADAPRVLIDQTSFTSASCPKKDTWSAAFTIYDRSGVKSAELRYNDGTDHVVALTESGGRWVSGTQAITSATGYTVTAVDKFGNPTNSPVPGTFPTC